MADDTTMEKIVFLPGASGNTAFWTPLIERLPSDYASQIIEYPGFGPADENQKIKSFNDLNHYVASQIQDTAVLIAQSMGGIFAVDKTLTDPDLVKGLVLIATSGGIDLSPFQVQDWRSEYLAQYPRYPHWFMQTKINFAAQLDNIEVPVLLLWGDDDPISPIAVGQYLKTQLKHAQLKIIEGGQHDLAQKHAATVSLYIQQFLATL
jgi:pimeloyl-ACP methyl ester carboxylesterase